MITAEWVEVYSRRQC